jgi:hypothetical protein
VGSVAWGERRERRWKEVKFEKGRRKNMRNREEGA